MMIKNFLFTRISLFILLFLSSDLHLFASETPRSNISISGNTTFRHWNSDNDKKSLNIVDQNLRIRAKNIADRTLDFDMNLRLRADLKTGDYRLRAYIAQLSWKELHPKIDLKLGRIYPELGSASGDLDGLDFLFRSTKNLKINGFAGIPVSFQNSSENRKFDRFQFGSGFSFSRQRKFRIEGYFVQRLHRGKTEKQQIGLSGYGTPLRNFTIYSLAKYNLQNREPTQLILQLEYKLFRYFNIITKYNFSLYGLENLDEKSIYREAAIGTDLRVGRRFFLRSEYGTENVDGNRLPNFRVNLTSMNLIFEVDLMASYQLRGDLDRRFLNYSLSVDRDFLDYLNLKIDWRKFERRSEKSFIYSWSSLRFGASFSFHDRFDFSGEIEQTKNRVLRMSMNISHRF